MGISELDMNKYIITTPYQTPEHLVRESYILNLRVNFVNNRRMKIGDYTTAMAAFIDVVKRYPEHAFAYYYIARCATELYFEKMKNNKEWVDYADRFGVGV
jgi:anaerobic magnesium-protoporphyrin IX monomethyl ester cyclase